MPRGSANVKRKSGADEKEVGKDVWWAFMYVCCVNGVERVRPPLLSPHLIFFLRSQTRRNWCWRVSLEAW
jgi:hypothetical protein